MKLVKQTSKGWKNSSADAPFGLPLPKLRPGELPPIFPGSSPTIGNELPLLGNGPRGSPQTKLPPQVVILTPRSFRPHHQQ